MRELVPIDKVDSHQHFWRLERGDYEWLTPELGPIYRDFNPDDLRPHLKELGISKTVLVQAAETDSETDFLLMIAEETDFVAGVVGWIDMESPNAITRLRSLAENPLLKGIRPMIQDISDHQWMLQPHLEPVFQTLIELNLCFDALVKPVHLESLHELLRRLPHIKLVIDHGAKPYIAEGQFSEWSENMSLIASESMACCKLSGLISEAGEHSNFEQLKPYMDHLLASFGSERLMWGSDWPVVDLSSTYLDWTNQSAAYFSQLSPQAQNDIWAKTATDFYSL